MEVEENEDKPKKFDEFELDDRILKVNSKPLSFLFLE